MCHPYLHVFVTVHIHSFGAQPQTCDFKQVCMRVIQYHLYRQICIENVSLQDSFIFNSSGVTLDETNIAWQTDRDTRFKNPDTSKNISAAQLSGTTMPPSWPRDLSYLPNGLQNEHLIVWFRVSAFWKFKKLYGRLYAENSTSLPSGTYSLNVEYSILI